MPEVERRPVRIHESAEVSESADLGHGVTVWNQAQVRDGASIGDESIIGKNVYVGAHVQVGSRCKVQNNVSIYEGVTVEDGVFIGPHVCFTNDRLPRAIRPDGSMKGRDDWQISRTRVRHGASIGAHSVILPGLTVGSFAMVAAGSVVTRDVPDHALVMGSPARVVDFVCFCGVRLRQGQSSGDDGSGWSRVRCESCGTTVRVPAPKNGD